MTGQMLHIDGGWLHSIKNAVEPIIESSRTMKLGVAGLGRMGVPHGQKSDQCWFRYSSLEPQP